MAKISKSYGITCFRKISTGQLQVLLVKKRYTYEFAEFVTRPNRNKAVDPAIFDHMTIDEKIIIYSLDFYIFI